MNNNSTNKEATTRGHGSFAWKPFLYGALIGALCIGGIMWVAMPKLMLTTHISRFDTVDETAQQLKTAIEAHGWNSPMIRNMNQSMEKSGQSMDRQIRIVELCHAGHAESILSKNPEVSTLMPCAWGVYEGDTGEIVISGMNMGLMGRMFGGHIAKVMSVVASDERHILKGMIR